MNEIEDKQWPEKSYSYYLAQRVKMLKEIIAKPSIIPSLMIFYKKNYINFIEDWCITYDPRNVKENRPSSIPFILFPIQKEFCNFAIQCILDGENGLVEKSRDMGATWLCCALSVWLWLFYEGSSVGFGSRKQDLVDRIGDPSSIFEKMRMLILSLPPFFLPDKFEQDKHLNFMKIINPSNGSTIIGESGSAIGRGGRTLAYFKDESAWYEHPESVEAALSENTDCQIDMSSVNGTSNLFYRKRQVGELWEPEKKIGKGVTRVFIMDWKDHPLKDQDWYDVKKARYEREGNLPIFYQEIDRNYSASKRDIVIKPEWVKSSIDAHKKLELERKGEIRAALDVADEGPDSNALVFSQGIVLFDSDLWSGIDTTQTARKAGLRCIIRGATNLQYDSIGVGAGVKGELNRLKSEGILSEKLESLAWIANAAPNYPKRSIIKGDRDSPKNKDFFANLKAQAWWILRNRFEKTWKVINGKAEYSFDELISIDSNIPNLHQIEIELSQPTYAVSLSSGKIVINKTPSGSKSPNLGDAIAMLFNPVRKKRYLI